MARMYAQVWKQLQKTKRVVVEVQANRIDSFVAMVVKEKYLDEQLSKKLDVPGKGKLNITRDYAANQVTFVLVPPLSKEAL